MTISLRCRLIAIIVDRELGAWDYVMRVGVAGLWHLGCVTAACLADAGHDVIAFDPNADRVAQLRNGSPPLSSRDWRI